MPATMAEKVAKDFMIIIKKFFSLGLLLLMIFFACKDENPEVFIDELPLPTPFQLTLNLDLPSNQSLEFEKNLILPDVGLKGVIVIRRDNNTYAAFERTCPFQPDEDCSLISMNASQLYLECGCGDSFYNLSGYPTNSPSPRKLREYYSTVSGNILYLDNTIVRSANQ